MRDKERLSTGLAKLNIQSSPDQIKQTLQWLELLARWSRVYNLTAIVPEKRVEQLVLMSVAALPYIRPTRVLDVGSGAGVPGLLLAIFAPMLQLTLVDSTRKKALFMRQAVMELKLKNVQVYHQRIDDLQEKPYHTIVSRAFSSAQHFFKQTQRLAQEGTCWITWKGKKVEQEVQALATQEAHCSQQRLSLSGLAQTTLIIIEQ